jgi:anti-anti-sigma regulatory factor
MVLPQISQRQANLVLMASQAGVCVVVGIAALVFALGPAMLGGAIIGFLLFAGLTAAYLRGWEWPRYGVVAALTLLTSSVISLDIARIGGFTPAFFVPPVLALILTGPLTIGISGLTMLLVVGLALPAPNPYVEPVRVVMVLVVLGGMMLARVVLDAERRQREQAMLQAQQAQQEAEREAETARRQAVELEERNEAQRRLLDLVGELETPSVALSAEVLLAPIIGSLDTRRIASLNTKLLRDVSTQRVQRLVLDLTGVTVVDTQVAQALGRLVAGVRLLGCDVTVTGVSAKVALTLAELGVDFGEVQMARSPREALEQHIAGPARRK